MKYSVQVRILKEAQVRLKNNSNTFVCHAIKECAAGKEHSKEANQLRSWVQNLLGPGVSTLQCWEIHRGYPKSTPEQRRERRIAWIDWMIEEWSRP